MSRWELGAYFEVRLASAVINELLRVADDGSMTFEMSPSWWAGSARLKVQEGAKYGRTVRLGWGVMCVERFRRDTWMRAGEQAQPFRSSRCHSGGSEVPEPLACSADRRCADGEYASMDPLCRGTRP